MRKLYIYRISMTLLYFYPYNTSMTTHDESGNSLLLLQYNYSDDWHLSNRGKLTVTLIKFLCHCVLYLVYIKSLYLYSLTGVLHIIDAFQGKIYTAVLFRRIKLYGISNFIVCSIKYVHVHHTKST